MMPSMSPGYGSYSPSFSPQSQYSPNRPMWGATTQSNSQSGGWGLGQMQVIRQPYNSQSYQNNQGYGSYSNQIPHPLMDNGLRGGNKGSNFGYQPYMGTGGIGVTEAAPMGWNDTPESTSIADKSKPDSIYSQSEQDQIYQRDKLLGSWNSRFGRHNKPPKGMVY